MPHQTPINTYYFKTQFCIVWLLILFLNTTSNLSAHEHIHTQPSWHNVLNRALVHHPDIQKALREYYKKDLQIKQDWLHWSPHLESTQVSKQITPDNLNNRFDFQGMQAQTTASWNLPLSATQIKINNTVSVGNKNSNTWRATLTQPIFSKAFFDERLRWHKHQQAPAHNALELRKHVYAALLKTSRLYNDIVQLQIQKKELESSIEKLERDKALLTKQIAMGTKAKGDLNIDDISILQRRLELVAKNHKIQQKTTELMLAIGEDDPKNTALLIHHDKTLDKLPKRLSVPLDPLPMVDIINRSTALIGLKEELYEQRAKLKSHRTERFPQLGVSMMYEKSTRKDSKIASLNASLPLDQRTLSYQMRQDSLQYQERLSRWATECTKIQTDALENQRSIEEQRQTILLEVEKLKAQAQDVSNTEKLYEMGRVSKSDLNTKKTSYLSAKLRLNTSIGQFLNEINQYDIDNNQFLHINRLQLPDTLERIFEKAQSETLGVDSTENTPTLCKRVLEKILQH